MSDETQPEPIDRPEILAPIEIEIVTSPEGPEPPEVALVSPAEACEVLDTESLSVPTAPEAPAGPDLSGLAREMGGRLDDLAQALGRRLDALQSSFDREVRAEATREKVVDRLHAELQEYKQNLLLSILRPVFIDLIQLHDDVGKLVEAQKDDELSDPDRIRRTLRGIQQGLEDVLYRQGVEPYSADGDGFDARSQRAVATVPTDEPGRNRTVAGRLRPGFRAGDRIVRPELVSVFAAH